MARTRNRRTKASLHLLAQLVLAFALLLGTFTPAGAVSFSGAPRLTDFVIDHVLLPAAEVALVKDMRADAHGPGKSPAPSVASACALQSFPANRAGTRADSLISPPAKSPRRLAQACAPPTGLA